MVASPVIIPRAETDRTVCIIDPENAASIRVAEKCGFVEARRTEMLGSQTIVFERKRRR